MSRLDSNAEPSMEEILASIRRIIAEEPPGSRQGIPPIRPGGAPSPSPSPQRGFMSREAFMRSSAPPEPEDEPSPAAPSGGNASLPSAAAPGRDESAAAPVAQKPIAEQPEARSTSGAEPAADVVNIDAQLASLLSDDLKALQASPDLRESGAVASATAQTEEAQNAGEARETQASGVSGNGAADDAASGQDADPFSFDLGPSPFLARSPAVEKPSMPSESAEPARVITASKDPSKRQDEIVVESKPINGAATHPVFEKLDASPVQPARSEPIPAPGRPSQPFVVPSVAATLGPARKLEPLSAAFQPLSPDIAASGPGLDLSPLALEGPLANGAGAHAEEERGKSRGQLQSPIISDESLDRAIEDTVADLLRPMLRTWLAENMPRIVERALRREMSERLLAGKKSSAD